MTLKEILDSPDIWDYRFKRAKHDHWMYLTVTYGNQTVITVDSDHRGVFIVQLDDIQADDWMIELKEDKIKKEPEFITDKFYKIKFILGKDSPGSKTKVATRIVSYIGKLGNKHCFDDSSKMRVFGPMDMVITGPADRVLELVLGAKGLLDNV